jgi:periplasmic protein TonB
LRTATVIISVGLHVGLAVGLVAVAQKRELRHRAISVAVSEEKRKAKPPSPPKPPRPIARPAAAKPVALAKAEAPVAVAHVAAAPMVTNLSMSNAGLDIGPGIGLEGRAAKPAVAAPVKVASALSEARTRRTQQEASGGGDVPCEEEPTKPEPMVQTPAINYTLYPQAQSDGIEGKFRAQVVVDANGEVTDVVVVAGVEPALDAAVVAALKGWRFKPAMACGKPVAGGLWKHAWVFELGD